MSNIWIVSDTHFGHANILKFKDDHNNLFRGNRFSSVGDMDEHMVERWNSVVKDGDKIYHLGDVFFGLGHTVLNRLRGQKRLILGNHDNGKDPHIQKYFNKIMMWRMFPEFNVVLTHVPIHDSGLEYKVKWNVHGHIHQQVLPDLRYFNASVEQIDYTPINMEDVVSQLAARF